MKIFITGLGGFVASHLIDLCLKNGDEICGSIRWYEDLYRLGPYQDKVIAKYADLNDLSSIIRAIADTKPDVIAHLGAQSWVPFSFSNPIVTLETNTIGTLNLLEAVRIIHDYIDPEYKPLIHICSSSEFYGKVERKDLPITEMHPANPGNPYGVGKVGADYISQLYNKYYGMRIIITRMFTHCGVGRTMMSAENYYARQIALIEQGAEPIIKMGNMKSIRTWADVRDAVKAYYELYLYGKPGEIYNISGETTKSIQEVLDYLLSISKIDVSKIKFVDEPKYHRKIDVDLQVVDISKFKEDIKWRPEITFEQLMQDLLNFWREKVKTNPYICEVN
jgi:GDPmannose 4,6-dehydratase